MFQPKDFELQHKDVSLIQVSKEMDLTRALLVVLKKMLADRITPFLLLSNSSTKELLRVASEASIDLASPISERKLVVIDCVSKYNDQKGEEGALLKDDIYYASSPMDLSDVALKVSEAMSETRSAGEKWLLIDSITAMTMYNTVGGILRFMQFLFKKLRMLNFEGVVVVVRDGTSQSSLLTELKRYCNTVIFLTQ